MEDKIFYKKIALILFEFVFIIAMLSAIIILSNKQNVVAKIKIDGISKTGIEDITMVEQALYNEVVNNIEPVVAIDGAASLVDDSISSTESDGFTYTSFTVELPKIDQKYRITYYKADNKDAVITSAPVTVERL